MPCIDFTLFILKRLLFLHLVGQVKAVRFLQQYENGKGDYTKDREKIISEMNMESFWKNMEMEH